MLCEKGHLKICSEGGGLRKYFFSFNFSMPTVSFFILLHEKLVCAPIAYSVTEVIAVYLVE